MMMMVVAAALAGGAASALPPPQSDTKPAVLFCSPYGYGEGYVDLEYLRNMSATAGIEGDLTASWSTNPISLNLTWDKIRQYNVLVLYGEPEGIVGSQSANQTKVPAELTAPWVATVMRFIKAGGGVLLMPTELNKWIQLFPTLTATLGAKLPLETLTETDPNKRGSLPRMSPTTGGALAYTAEITPGHAVTAGVSGLWYPTQLSFNGQMTGPIVVDNSTWTVLVRGSNTSHSSPTNLSHFNPADPNPFPPHAFQHSSNYSGPALFAVRDGVDGSTGRAALLNQFRQFTVGAGSRWLYDSVVMSRGLKGLPSDAGRLLENTYRWLARPSLGKGVLGGWQHTSETYSWPNDKPANLAIYADIDNAYASGGEELSVDPVNPKLRTLRGLIGARTVLSGGNGTVADFALAAAGAAKLDFLVFLEDFAAFAANASKFDKLLAECAAHSTDSLLLLPGYPSPAPISDPQQCENSETTLKRLGFHVER